MSQYCPKCLGNTLSLKSKGVIHVIINGKQMDAGRVLYNRSLSEDLLTDLTKKLEEFFRWYSGFQNPDPISSIELVTSDFVCENKCAVDISFKQTVVDTLVNESKLNEILNKLAQKYKLTLSLF